MTREEAKEILTHNWTRVDNPNYSESELDEAIFMAIEALSADTVSREHHDMEIKELQHQIKDQADMVSVVRCKDCRHAYFKDFDGYCPHMVNMLKPDGFCYRGERQCNYFGEKREK